MIKILTIIGTRPQIIKSAALSREIQTRFKEQVKEVILHTGQHYNENLSKVFFNELRIQNPDYNLHVGSATHAVQTAHMLDGIEGVILSEKPDCVVLYGDTNSTLAGALAAVKLHCPVVHIEAGLRSFNKSMPEEINRIVCDHCSTLLFTPTRAGYNNLVNEGFNPKNESPFTPDNPGIFHCGDVMFDNTLFFAELAREQTNILEKLNLKGKEFVLATIHRPSNTDHAEQLSQILHALVRIATENNIDIVLPVHPRTEKMIQRLPDSKLRHSLVQNDLIKLIPAVSYLEMTSLEENATMIMTDSGGVQKEAYFFNKPAIILRNETEWIEIVENNCALLTGADESKIIVAFNSFLKNPPTHFPSLFGDGNAAEFICERIVKNFGK